MRDSSTRGIRSEPPGGGLAAPGGGFGGEVRARRLAAGLTQTELARRAGVGLGTVRDLEQGRTHRPVQHVVTRLAGALDFDPADLRFPASAGTAETDLAGTGLVRIRVLGPLEVWRRGTAVKLGSVKERVTLGVLALTANTVVHREALIDAVWGTHPPTTAGDLVQGYAGRLRRRLDPGRGPREAAGLLLTVGAGYRLQVSAGQLDLLEFGELSEEARAASARGGFEDACRAYEQSLRLWHGGVLADIGALKQHPAVLEVSRRRTAIICDYADAAHAAGIPGDVLAYLREQADSDPLDERVHARLMTALAATGQQAAALKVYDALRHRLDEQLGVQPSAEITQAHLGILRQEIPAALTRADALARAAGAPTPAPCQLPACVPHFAGRVTEMETLAGALAAASEGGTVAVATISGTAGIGKTALAVHWARMVASRFPDGQLYVNLRGYDPSAAPVAPEQAIRGFLEALQVDPGKIPMTPQAQAGLYRTLLAGLRVLIVLDNALDEQHVRPLLPADPACLVIVTSRNPLSGLLATNAAQPVSLGLPSDTEAREMLARRLGTARVAAEPDVVPELVTLCARLPLALAVTAARAAVHPDRPLATIAAQLRDQRSRLAALDAGDPSTSVRAVFSWSCQGLSPAAGRMFRLLSLHPGPEVTIPAAASLAATAPEPTRELLHELTRAGLLREQAADRFALHDLLRAYASEQAHARDSARERDLATISLLDYYQAAAAAAMDECFPAEKHRRPQVPPAETPVASVPDAAAGMDWLNAERACLIALTVHAATGWPDYAIRLAGILDRYLMVGGHLADAHAAYACALDAAWQTGDLAAQAESLKRLGVIEAWRGDYDHACTRLTAALELYRETGNKLGQARTLDNLSSTNWWQGRYHSAADQLGQALELFRALGERVGESIALINLSFTLDRQEQYEQAVTHSREALAICTELGDRHTQAMALERLAMALCRLSRLDEAQRCADQALAIYREFGDRHGEADVLGTSGHILQESARYREALRCHRQAAAIVRELGDRSSEADALNSLGEALRRANSPELACADHLDALTVAREVGARYEEARAHNGLAYAYQATGDQAQAREHWRHALGLYTEMGVPEADRVAAMLSALPPVAGPV